MKAFGSRERPSMRVLSPRMLPRFKALLGSIAKTATLCPRSVSAQPTVSMKALLPAPGGPVTPTRIDCPVWGRSWASRACADFLCWEAALSTKVMARARAARSPASTSFTWAPTSIDCLLAVSFIANCWRRLPSVHHTV